MSRRFSPLSLSLLRSISDDAREILMLTKPYRPPMASDIQTGPHVLLHLPDVRSPVQYLIDMGLRPALARHISSVYIEFVARYRQVFKSHFRRIIRDGCHLHPDHYRNVFIVQFKGTIQVWESQIVSTVCVWLCQAGLSPTVSHPQCMNVSATISKTRLSGINLLAQIRVDGVTKAKILSRLGLTSTPLMVGLGLTLVCAHLMSIRPAWNMTGM